MRAQLIAWQGQPQLNGLAVLRAHARRQAMGKEAVDIATDAYVYGNSLVTTDVTRIQTSNVPAMGELKGPSNQFVNVKRV